MFIKILFVLQGKLEGTWNNTNICMGSRGSTPRTTLTGKRRVVVDTRNNDNDKKIKYSSSQGVNPGIRNGSKFKNLRNRRGVKRDKLLQTRLDLSMVFSGDSNSPLSQGRDKSGKRKASLEDNVRSMKFKSGISTNHP